MLANSLRQWCAQHLQWCAQHLQWCAQHLQWWEYPAPSNRLTAFTLQLCASCNLELFITALMCMH